MIENQTNEMTLICHSGKSEDKKSRAFVESLSEKYKVKILDLTRDKLTETQLAEIADKMDVSLQELCNTTYVDEANKEQAINHIKGLSDADLLVLLVKQPILVNTPILIVGKNAYSYQNGFELFYKNITTEGVASRSSANAEEKR